MPRKRFTTIKFLVAIGSLAFATATSCSTAAQYQCPLCGGIEVSSCDECDGYLSAGTKKPLI
jgi:hypothetical protein